jgi:hypothetical protein
VEDVVSSGIETVRGLAVDSYNGMIYWTDLYEDAIRRAELDGTGVADVIDSGLAGAHGIAVDPGRPAIVQIDIQPDACPNVLKGRTHNALSAVIYGSEIVPVDRIVADSVTLRRVDDLGILARQAANLPRSRRVRDIIDIGSPGDASPCACTGRRLDGIEDLTVTFSTAQVYRFLRLDDAASGETVDLAICGVLDDGRCFRGIDCVEVIGPPGRTDDWKLTR